MKKILAGLLVALVALPLVACGTEEGDSCKTDNDCSSQLFCQVIQGRGDKCCPAPPESSDNVSCHGTTSTTLPVEPVVTASPSASTSTEADGGS